MKTSNNINTEIPMNTTVLVKDQSSNAVAIDVSTNTLVGIEIDTLLTDEPEVVYDGCEA